MEYVGLVIVDWMDARGMTCCEVDNDNDGTEAYTLNWDRPGNPVVAYRIRKEPVRDTVSLGIHQTNGVWWTCGELVTRAPTTITFPTSDGAPITGTYINESGDEIVMEAIGDG